MRFVSVVIVLSAFLATSSTACLSNESASPSSNFQICESDNPKGCETALYLPCGANPQRIAEVSCRQKGSWFYTLSKIKEVAGGQCGVTIFGVKCE